VGIQWLKVFCKWVRGFGEGRWWGISHTVMGHIKGGATKRPPKILKALGREEARRAIIHSVSEEGGALKKKKSQRIS